jgi:hypothetical protein
MARKKCVPVEDLKRQINARMSEDSSSFYCGPSPGVPETWSMCPCNAKRDCLNGRYCYGSIYVKMKGCIIPFEIELKAIRQKQRTFIVQDAQYLGLMERGGFGSCQEVWVDC